MTTIVIGGAIVLITCMVFGPFGLLILIPLALMSAWFFKPSKPGEGLSGKEMDDALKSYYGRK